MPNIGRFSNIKSTHIEKSLMKFHKKTIFVNKSNPSKTKTLKKCPIAKINTGERFK
jgi:hypothetical protein